MPEPPAFHHADAGTPEPAWLLDPRWAQTPVVDVEALARSVDALVVAAAHPDDETLAVGGLVARAHAAGLPVRVVVATDGSASHPDATAWTPDQLARVRAVEVAAAVDSLAPGSSVVHLGLPDGGLADAGTTLEDALAAECDEGRVLLVAPWTADGHPDHDALGRAAVEAGRRTGARVALYPLWLWHWGSPDDLDWSLAHVVELDRAALDAKAEALQRHTSQTAPLGPCPGDAPVVTEPVLTRAGRLVEVLLADPSVLPSRPSRDDEEVAGAFDEMYADSRDPWGFADSFYERRKRDLVAAVLGRPSYRRVLEIGCADGALTEVLASRSHAMVSIDVSEQALARARSRDLPGVQWRLGRAPGAIDDGPYDAVVLSEVGYFLTPLELLDTLRRSHDALAGDGELVLVHWRHPTEGIPLDGPAVHAQAATVLAALPHRVHYEDADVLVDVWGGGEASVAAREGRA